MSIVNARTHVDHRVDSGWFRRPPQWTDRPVRGALPVDPDASAATRASPGCASGSACINGHPDTSGLRLAQRRTVPQSALPGLAVHHAALCRCPRRRGNELVVAEVAVAAAADLVKTADRDAGGGGAWVRRVRRRLDQPGGCGRAPGDLFWLRTAEALRAGSPASPTVAQVRSPV